MTASAATAAAALAGAAAVVAARTLRWLTPGGAGAAVAIGGAVLAGAGAHGILLLLLFFVGTSLLTGDSACRRSARLGDHLGRSAVQVLANGGAAAACGLLLAAGAGEWAWRALAGALAAATADSWATEVGTASGARTWRITGGRVEPGCSGGVSVAGTAAGLAGAALLAWTAAVLSRPGHFVPAGFLPIFTAGGFGMVLDSLLGATLEGRSRLATNETTNLAATAAGALTAGVLG